MSFFLNRSFSSVYAREEGMKTRDANSPPLAGFPPEQNNPLFSSYCYIIELHKFCVMAVKNRGNGMSCYVRIVGSLLGCSKLW